MDRIVERPGALDVHKASVTACVRVWESRKLTEQIAEFQTTVAGLLALGDWLAVPGRKTDTTTRRGLRASGMRAVARQLRAAQADPRAQGPDAVSQGAD